MSAAEPGLELGAGDGGGWLARRDPRLRVLAAVAFALVTLALGSLPALCGALALALFLALAGGQGLARLGCRLVLMEGFLAVLLLTLPFTVPGSPILDLGPLVASREGLVRAFVILLKANTVVLALLGLVGGLEPAVFGHALGRLGVPRKLVHLLLQTVRQIHLLGQEHRRLRQAMRARAFVPRSDRHTWNSYGWLIGMLLVRALGRSRRVLAAMRCRGFRGHLYLLDTPAWTTGDSAFAAALGIALAAFLTLGQLP
ncbi:MAG: cobalt ECF transporter T component CbiQ [Bdellovibrio bacteriovorus]